MTEINEKCANCGRSIGQLETPHVWHDNIVCTECATRLSSTPVVAKKSAIRKFLWMIVAVIMVAGVLVFVYIPRQSNEAAPSKIVATPAKQTELKLPILATILSNDKMTWDWRFRDLKPDNDQDRYERKVRTGAEKSAEFDQWSKTATLSLTEEEAKILQNNPDASKELIQDLPSAFGHGYGYLHLSPIRFANIDNKRCIYIGRHGIDTVYNTLKLTERQMASNVLKEVVIPRLSSAAWHVGKFDVSYIGVSTAFYSKDFSKDYLSPSAINLAMVSSTQDICAFNDKNMSVDDLVERSKIYLDTGRGFDLVKIKIE